MKWASTSSPQQDIMASASSSWQQPLLSNVDMETVDGMDSSEKES